MHAVHTWLCCLHFHHWPLTVTLISVVGYISVTPLHFVVADHFHSCMVVYPNDIWTLSKCFIHYWVARFIALTCFCIYVGICIFGLGSAFLRCSFLHCCIFGSLICLHPCWSFAYTWVFCCWQIVLNMVTCIHTDLVLFWFILPCVVVMYIYLCTYLIFTLVGASYCCHLVHCKFLVVWSHLHGSGPMPLYITACCICTLLL